MARGYFENALRIDPGDPDYHYYLGRCHETEREWSQALEQYEETYRLNPEYRLGDILREVGKGYLHTGNVEKGIEFLRFFLAKRSSDPEGRYWLAVALAENRGKGRDAGAAEIDPGTGSFQSEIFPKRKPGMDLPGAQQ